MANDIKGVEIFAEGTWIGSLGLMKWSAEDVDEIVKNTNTLIKEGVMKPPRLKFGHSEEQIGEAVVMDGQMDGDPALGSVVNLQAFTTDFGGGDGKKRKRRVLKADFVDMPDIVFQAVEAKLYTDVSAEVEFIKGIGWFISAVALLGADIPAVKGLSDLQTFLTSAEFENVNHDLRLCFSEPRIKGGNMPDPVATGDQPSASNSNSTETVNKLLEDNSKLRNDFSAKEKEVSDLTTVNKTQAEELKKYKENALRSLFAEQKEKILSPYRKDVEDKKLMPALLDKVEACLESQKAGFTEDSQLSIEPELVLEIAKAYNEAMLSGHEGEGGGAYSGGTTDVSPDEVFEKECKIAMGQFKMTYKEASDHVSMTKPELLQAYTEWTDEVSALGKAPNLN